MDSSMTRWLLHNVDGFDEPVCCEEIVDLFCDDRISVDTIVQPVAKIDDATWEPIAEATPLCEDEQLGYVIGDLLSHRYMKLQVFRADGERPTSLHRSSRRSSKESFSLLFALGFFPLFLLGTLFFTDGSTPWMFPTDAETGAQSTRYQPSEMLRSGVSLTFAAYLGIVAAWVIFGIINLTRPTRLPMNGMLEHQTEA